jgi:tol-pal system protein YbgF
MNRLALSVLLLAAAQAASCAGFQKVPGPLRQQVKALRLRAAETRLAALGPAAPAEAPRAQAPAVEAPQAAPEPAGPPQAEAPPPSPAAEPRPAPTPQAVSEPAAPPEAPAPPAATAEAPETKDSPEALYEAALKLLLEEHQAAEAKAALERFVAEHPGHALVPNALYWTGECLYDQRDWAAAVLAFRQVAADFPDHPKAAAALLKMGYSYLRLKDETNASDYLGRVGRLYPGSQEAARASAALERLDQAARKAPRAAGKAQAAPSPKPPAATIPPEPGHKPLREQASSKEEQA